ncbi:hypothetical protein Tco_0151601 [Tanacetum coccineum]
MSADPLLQQQDIAIWLALQMKFEKTQVPHTACRSSAICLRDQDDPHDDTYPEGENSTKRQKTSEYEAYVSGESSSGQVNIGTRSFYFRLKIFLQVTLFVESKRKILVFPHPRKITPLVQSCQRDPEAPTLSLINQDLLYLKKGNSGPEKVVLSLHKFPAIKNPHAKIFYIRRHKEPGRLKEEIYSNSKIVQVIKTFWELGHEHNYQQKINLIAPTITFPGIEECDVFSIVYKHVRGIIYTKRKKEKRVMRPSEIHKFCDATLRRTLEGLKSYYNDVKYGYVQKELTNDELEFLKLFKE